MTNSTFSTRCGPSRAIRIHPNGMRPEFQSESGSPSIARCMDSCPDEGTTSAETATLLDDIGDGAEASDATFGVVSAGAVIVGRGVSGLGAQAAKANSTNSPIVAMQRFFIRI